MKNFALFILVFIFVIVAYLFVDKDEGKEVINVVSMSDFYVDFNGNKVADENELVQLFITNPINSEISKVDYARLSYLGLEFAKETLLHKKIKILYDKSGATKIILPNGVDYRYLLEQNGFVAGVNKELVSKNIESAKKLNLVSYNPHSKKYHKLDCKYAFSSSDFNILKFENIAKDAKPCMVCHTKNKSINVVKSLSNNSKAYPRDVFEKYSPIYKDSNIEFFVTDFTKYYYPSQKCLTSACMALVREINSAKSSIDFAIYGIDGQLDVINALINAQKRGVKIRWVYDTDKNGNTIYLDTFKLKKYIPTAVSDSSCAGQFLSNGKKLRDSIMHNKFFIFDSKKVWTGSANISHTDLSGFNANSVFLINSPVIAQIYKSEFEQMYSGKFHQLKVNTLENFNNLGSSQISVYFSPQDKVLSKYIIPLINKSRKYVYVPVFVITHKDFTDALVMARNRGVDVRLIVDATSAGSKYSSVKLLRQNAIKVKTENRAGKMHMKSIIIDDEYVISGSMNFTKSGESYNDENILIIKNSSLAKAFKNKFLYLYNAIPDKWLYKNPAAESFNSINSCFDGVDNDFDEKNDMADDSCNFKLKKSQAKN